jgi:enoyl-CoA hydratase
MKEFSTLAITRDGDVAQVTLRRPEVMNRIDATAHSELIAAFRSFEGDGDLRAIVFAAEGPVFSAGGDFDLMLACNADLQTRRETVASGERLLAALLDVVPPIVVALHGDAIGLGATLVLSCDAVVSHPACSLSDPHVPIGLVAGDGGCLAWPQSVGMLRAKRHLLTGDPLTGEEAHRFGLVTDLVDTPDDVLSFAWVLARRLAALPPIAVQGTKRVLNAVLRHRFAEVMGAGLALELETLGSRDLREAISAFQEKRHPQYGGN